jgi:putative membrane protein
MASLGTSAQSSKPSPGPGSSEKDAGSKLSVSEKTFMKKAAAGGVAEVELGRLATEKAQNEQVKKFGQRMVDDHSKANDRLKQIARDKGLDISNDLNAKDKATKEHLSKLSGQSFDRAYSRHMLQDHQKDVADFRKESKTAKDSDVKSFATETLPILEEHLKMARDIAKPNNEGTQKLKND